MRLGLQQPYFFPYLAYFQLLFAVDRFVAYDDVNWIHGGWIHRNRLAAHDGPQWFTIPTRGASRHVPLDTVKVAAGRWREKMFRTLEQSYARAPFREPVLRMVERTLATPSPFVADIAVASLEHVRDYLGYTTPIHRARNRYEASAARGEERVIAICRAEGATEYLNAIGGLALYDRQLFDQEGITLRFLQGRYENTVETDDQGRVTLSIIHLLMYSTIEQVRTMMNAYDLV